MVEIREYLGRDGRNLFGDWFDHLNSEAARKVTTAVYRLGLGNFSNVKGVGSGVFECRIDFGPGYRVYFCKDGEQIVILLCGGSKKRQQNDIELAGEYWQDYKLRKRSEPWR
jgi:putative addiction module killer protein